MCKRGIKQLTDLSLAARSTVLGSDLQETVSIDLEGGNELGLATGHGGNTVELELAEETVVTALSTLTLVDGEGDGGLVVLNGGEDTRLVGGDGGVTGDDDTENVNLHGNTEGEGSNIEQEEVSGLVRGLAGKDGSLDSGTVCDSLVGVDRLVRLLAVEEVGNKLDDTWDTSGTTNQDNFVDVGLVDLRVTEDLLDGLESGAEEVLAELLETGTSERGVEIDTLEKRVDLDGGLGSRGEGTLGTLTSSTETTEGTGVGGDILEK